MTKSVQNLGTITKARPVARPKSQKKPLTELIKPTFPPLPASVDVTRVL